MGGLRLRILCDTGATTSFIHEKHLSAMKTAGDDIEVTAISDMNIRLGDNHVHTARSRVTGTVFLGDNIPYSSSFICMPLPTGIDAILGYDWFCEYNAWLNPKTNRMTTTVDGKSEVLSSISVAYDKGLPDSLNDVRLGVYTCAGSDTEYESVNSKEFRRRMKLFRHGKLDWHQCCRFENQSDISNLCSTDTAGQDLQAHSLRTDDSGQIFLRRVSVKQSADVDTDSDSVDESVFLIHVTYRPDGSFEIHTGTDSANENKDDSAAQHRVNHASTGTDNAEQHQSETDVPDTSHRNCILHDPEMTIKLNGAPRSIFSSTSSIPAGTDASAVLPDFRQNQDKQWRAFRHGRVASVKKWDDDAKLSRIHTLLFSDEGGLQNPLLDAQTPLAEGSFPIDERLVDATEAAYQSWVDDLLKHQTLGEFSCLKERKKWTPLPHDPLLKLELKGKLPKPQRYRVPVNLLPELKKFIQLMLEKGYISPCEAEFTSPVLVIKKPLNADGSSRGFRLVTDYRALNQVLHPYQWYMPDVTEMWEKLRHAKFISALDLKDGFWGAGLHPDSRHLTAFSTPYGVMSYNVVPQGLISSGLFFQRWMEAKLRRHGVLFDHGAVDVQDTDSDPGDDPGDPNDPDLQDADADGLTYKTAREQSRQFRPSNSRGFVAVYCDDLIVISNSAEQHKEHLLKLMQILSDENIHLNGAKSKCFCRYTRYLGAICGNGVLLMDPEKIRAILAVPQPVDVSKLRSFLGMAGFWRRWIANYAKISGPLNDLLVKEPGSDKLAKKKDKDFKVHWNSAHTDAFIALKRALCTYPVLRQPDPTKPFVVISDACDYAIGSVLANQLDDGTLVAVCYTSRCLHNAELNYSVQEKEMLGIIYSVQKYRHYLIGSPFEIRFQTDHCSLQFIDKPAQTAGRMARWAMIMQDYNYSISYIPGPTNHVGDALSRLIDVPAKDWKPLVLDDDSQYPFLLLWPEVKTFIDSQVHSIETLAAFADAFAEDSHDTGLYLHERVMFARYTAQTVDGDFKLRPEDYENCPDYAVLYRMLLRVMDETSDDAALHATQIKKAKHKRRKTDSGPKKKLNMESDTQPKLSWNSEAERKQLSKMDTHFIDPSSKLLYKVHKNIEVLCIPNVRELRYKVYCECHETTITAHRGSRATYSIMRRRFFWPNMMKSVETFVEACPQCQMYKKNRRKQQGPLQTLQIPTAPCQSYSIDFMTDMPQATDQKYDRALMVVDRFSQRIFVLPTKSTYTADMVWETFFDEICCRQCRGTPVELVSDRDTIFNSKFWRGVQNRVGTCVKMSSSRSQQTNGSAERSIAVIEEALMCFLNYKQDNWVAVLPHLQFAINQAPSAALKDKSPMFVEMGQDPVMPIDLAMPTKLNPHLTKEREDIETRVQRLHDLHDDIAQVLADVRASSVATAPRREIDKRLKVGAKAWLDLDGINLEQFNLRPSPKMNPLFYGPYEIISRPRTNSFRLKLPKGCRIHDVFSVSRLKAYRDPAFLGRKPLALPTELFEDREYELQDILDHDFKYGQWWFLVHWKGYSPIYESTWETRDSLVENAKSTLQYYEKKYGLHGSAQQSEDKPVSRPGRKRKAKR